MVLTVLFFVIFLAQIPNKREFDVKKQNEN